MTSVSVIVPTYNEAPNIPELFDRIAAACAGLDAEIVVVDDSSDDTPAVVTREAPRIPLPVRLIHREQPVGGLSGAVIAGLESSERDWCVVMDGDLQHPPELIPTLLATGEKTEADVVVASRHVAGGSTGGLENWMRHSVSSVSTVLTRAMFPVKLRNCSDPMTGFFALRRSSVPTEGLRPRGFKILLEILARNSLTVVEEPFVFGKRFAGESKASMAQGFRFLLQLTALRFGRLSAFAVIGALGAVANLLIMAGLLSLGTWYLTAAIVAAVLTIVGNFLLQERFVFHDLRAEGRSVWLRFGQSFAFNGSETLLRTGLLWLVVELTVVPSLAAQAGLLAIGFLARFAYHSRVVYRPRRTSRVSPLLTSSPAADLPAPVPDPGPAS